MNNHDGSQPALRAKFSRSQNCHRHFDDDLPDRIMTTFDSTKLQLPKILADILAGKIQLPDFQRGWVWDDRLLFSPPGRGGKFRGGIIFDRGNG
ncbi:hypothetical protein, partial [Lyngbya sp. CCY1209]|uniref:hypothetical protein n=1 Tax=Lyngbya sp. CCY1209 TaxID=2886103 RepID=UPI002D78AA8E